jgi:hypothetical protein
VGKTTGMPGDGPAHICGGGQRCKRRAGTAETGVVRLITQRRQAQFWPRLLSVDRQRAKRSPVQRIIAAEAAARTRAGDATTFDPGEVTPEVYRIMPPRARPEPPGRVDRSNAFIRSVRACRPTARWLGRIFTGVLVTVIGGWLLLYISRR